MISDRLIRWFHKTGEFVIQPWDDRHLQPISYEVTLGKNGIVPRKPDAMTSRGVPYADPRDPSTFPSNNGIEIPLYDSSVVRVIPSGGFILGETEQFVQLGPSMAARFEGKSSLARLGLFVHVTAGLVDPGWKGRLTVELFNAAPYSIRLYAGMPIGQMTFEKLSESVERPYGHPSLGSHFQGDMRVTGFRGLNCLDETRES